MQSPQPSGIPAVPSSPELFTVPPTKSKQTLFLESLLSSPSPKMYTSEVTVTKQQCEPLNLGKHRKSASPTITSCSDEIRRPGKEFGEPREKRLRSESTEDLAKITKVFNKASEDGTCKTKPDRIPRPCDENSPKRQLQILKTNPDLHIPDPLLVHKSRLEDVLTQPGSEIPSMLIQQPELQKPDTFQYSMLLNDPEVLALSLKQLEALVEENQGSRSSRRSERPEPTPVRTPAASDALAGDIDAATSAAFNQMMWLPYINQLACTQNMDLLKALNSSEYSGNNYPDLSQLYNNRLMGQGFPMMPPMDYDNRLRFAMWQEAMNQADAAAAMHKSKMDRTKESGKSNDLQNPHVHSTKSHHKSQSARTSPIAHNYNSHCQRAAMNHAFMQAYPGMGPVRPGAPLPGLQIPPYYNSSSMVSSQRSPRSSQQKSPTSPFYPNNNYLQQKASESMPGHREHRSSSTSSQESPRPRISVKNLQNLMEPAGRRHSTGRRREEPEVGSTTPGEPPPIPLPLPLPHNPHDPAHHHLWHPLFGNHKGYSSPWSWTQVTATGD